MSLAALGCGIAAASRLLPASAENPQTIRMSRALALVCVAAVLLALLIRLYHIDFGLPYPFHPDEYRKASYLNKMVRRHSLRPPAFLHPPLLLHFSIGLRSILVSLGLLSDAWNNVARMLLVGRLVSALAGAVTIIFVFLAGTELRSRLVGAGAAVLIAVAPLHVTCSRYLKEDILFTMFFTAALYFALLGFNRRRVAAFYIAGILCGASAASKYSGLLSGAMLLPLLSPRIWPELGGKKRALGIFIIACACIIIGFAAFSPYVLIDPHSYLKGLLSEARHAAIGHMGSEITGASQLWMYHLRRSIEPGIGAGCVVFGLLGAGIAIRRRDIRGLALVLPLAAFYLSAECAKSKPFPNPDRYVVQCLPILALLAFDALEQLLSAAALRRSLTAALSLAAFATIFQPAVRTIQLASELYPDTRLKMRQYVVQNVKPGERIALVGGAVYLPRIPNRYRVTSLRKIIGGGEKDFGARLEKAQVEYLLVTEMVNRRFKVGKFEDSRFYRMLQEIAKRYDLSAEIAPKFGPNAFHNPVLRLYHLRGPANAQVPPALETEEGTVNQR